MTTIYRKWARGWRKTEAIDQVTLSGQTLYKIRRGVWLMPSRVKTEAEWLAMQAPKVAKESAMLAKEHQIRQALREGPKTTAELHALTGIHWWPLGRLLWQMRGVRRCEIGRKYCTWTLRS